MWGNNGAVMVLAGVEWLPYLRELRRSGSDSEDGTPKTESLSRSLQYL